MNWRTLGLFLFFAINQAFGWGATGHRAVGLIASHHLSNKAAKRIDNVLGGKSLATVSTWMDEVRMNKSYYFMRDWHWVTIPEGMRYFDTDKNRNGDIIETLNKVIKEIKSKTLTPEEEAERLKILIHLVGDLHQPLHVGTGKDKGGNGTKVKWFGKSTNLHHVWDSGLIDHMHLGFTEFVGSLPKPGKGLIRRLQKTSILDWANESMQLRKQVYAIGDGHLENGYLDSHIDIVRNRIQAAGIRLAGILNSIYK